MSRTKRGRLLLRIERMAIEVYSDRNYFIIKIPKKKMGKTFNPNAKKEK